MRLRTAFQESGRAGSGAPIGGVSPISFCGSAEAGSACPGPVSGIGQHRRRPAGSVPLHSHRRPRACSRERRTKRRCWRRCTGDCISIRLVCFTTSYFRQGRTIEPGNSGEDARTSILSEYGLPAESSGYSRPLSYDDWSSSDLLSSLLILAVEQMALH